MPDTIAKRISPTEQGLFTARTFQEGETIITEAPLVSIPVLSKYRLGTYVWDLVAAILADADLLRKVTGLKLMATEQLMVPDDYAIEAHLVKQSGRSRALVRCLYFTVATNNIGIIQSARVLQGYGVFPMLSRSDHSCAPSAELQPHNPASGSVALVALRPIAQGMPITWSYFEGKEFLDLDARERNVHLVDLFRFVCRCDRCRKELPLMLPGVRDLLAHFDACLFEMARGIRDDPAALRDLEARSPMQVHRDALRRAGGQVR